MRAAGKTLAAASLFTQALTIGASVLVERDPLGVLTGFLQLVHVDDGRDLHLRRSVALLDPDLSGRSIYYRHCRFLSSGRQAPPSPRRMLPYRRGVPGALPRETRRCSKKGSRERMPPQTCGIAVHRFAATRSTDQVATFVRLSMPAHMRMSAATS